MSKNENSNLDYIIKVIVVLLLLIPFIFGYNIKYLFATSFTLFKLGIILFGIIFLAVVGYYLIPTLFTSYHLEKMKEHEVIMAFLKKDYDVLYKGFLFSMILEELIFRFYIGTTLIQYIDVILILIISGIIFSFYHFHIWFGFKNVRILGAYLFFSFLLGIFNMYVLFELGLIFCIILHYLIVLMCYWRLFKIVRIRF
ncbi:MAG: putative CAAX amino terminal protease self-immunity [Promethearchaeota archaeon]|nr:MAG: putative CAAX amino terminal protease self-immunity [Candidatus Lokiarchaeota archaeon]